MDPSGSKSKEIPALRTWLVSVLGCQIDEVPEFEINENTIELLYTLRRLQTETDQNIKDITQDFKLKSREYMVESKRYHSLIRKVGGDDNLSARGQSLLNALVSTAIKLQLGEPSDPTFILALCRVLQDIQASEHSKTEQKASIVSLELKTKDVIQKSSHLQRILNLTSKNAIKMEMDVNKLNSKNSNLPKKIQEYGKMVEKLQLMQYNCGVSPQMYHQAVLKSNEELKQLSRKLTGLRGKLDAYCGLPCNIELTQEKIESAKQELAALEIDLAQKIEKSLV